MGPAGKRGRAARLPRTRRDAAGIALLIVLLEAALAIFLVSSFKWSLHIDQPGRGIVLVFSIATGLTFLLFGFSLLVDTLPVLLGGRQRKDTQPRD